MITRDLGRTNAAAMTLQRNMREIKLIGGAGMVLGGLGYAGLKLTETLVKPATEYAHQLNIMNMAGLKHAEIAEAVSAAWKNTSTVITTTATQNLRTLLDLRNVIAETNTTGLTPQINMDVALRQLPIVSKIQAVMAASSEVGVRKAASDNFAFSMAKALDIVGAAVNPAEFEKQAAMMAKVITAFQGRVTPQQFQGVFQYARQAKYRPER